MGRRPASPQTQSQLECLAIVSAMATAMMIACAFAVLCPCCAGPAIILWLVAAQAGCLAFA
jgi:hypothetical protein